MTERDCAVCSISLDGYHFNAVYCADCRLGVRRRNDAARYARNAERCAVQHKDWVQRNREKRTAYLREWQASHRDKVSEYHRRWANRNAEKRHSIRAKRRSAFVESVDPLRVYERDGWRCQLCGRPVRQDVKHPHPQAPVIDHILPISVGGTHEYRNVQTAHHLCNSSKSNRVVGAGEQLRLIG